ncbi:site-specific integrase [Lysobacter korlensis]|uniref:Site-specific integrase n=1 Tax=Lysobacter korlensis TaxID=553636 RepID=A0ABV6RS63_9GAMM
MRTGEVDGLRWQNVDFEQGVIRVREVFTAGESEANVKTTGSFRDIPMLPVVRDVLSEHRATSYKLNDHVFTTRSGKPICARNFTNRIWNPLLDRLGLARRRPYQTRHTAATLMLAAGENSEWVARVLGHANTQMLFTVYSRYVPNLTRADGTAISALVGRSWGA